MLQGCDKVHRRRDFRRIQILQGGTIIRRNDHKSVSGEELEALIDQVIAELGATSKKQMGQVMGALGKSTGGNFDKPAAAKIVGAKLA